MESEVKKLIYGGPTDRRLLHAFNYADYGQLSCVVIQLEGSPPKGTAIIMLSDIGGVKSNGTIVFLKRYHSDKFTKITSCGYSAMWRTFTDFVEGLINENE